MSLLFHTVRWGLSLMLQKRAHVRLPSRRRRLYPDERRSLHVSLALDRGNADPRSENIGDVPVVMLEVLRTDRFTDISLAQWIGVTPPQIIKDTLMLPDDIIGDLTSSAAKVKKYIVY